MTFKTIAVYYDGMLHPATPLPLDEGATVEIAVTRVPASTSIADAADERIQNAKTLEEWIEAANAAPPEDDDYDLYAAMNVNRKGQRQLFPQEMKGISW